MPKGKKGKKAPKNAGLGRAIVHKAQKDRVKRMQENHEGSGFAVADLTSTGKHLQSVTDSTSIDDFMASAMMTNRDFTADRETAVMVGSDGTMYDTASHTVAPAQPTSTPGSAVRPLQIPRRPEWHESMTPAEIRARENQSFLAWRRQLAEMEEARVAAQPMGAAAGGPAVTPFEKNPDIWRQLWRVVERSDVVVQVVDARHPMLFRCPDLEEYVKEISPNKENLVLFNKGDFLSPMQRLEWARYFDAQGVDFLFFSAMMEQAKLDEADRQLHSLHKPTHFSRAAEGDDGGSDDGDALSDLRSDEEPPSDDGRLPDPSDRRATGALSALDWHVATAPKLGAGDDPRESGLHGDDEQYHRQEENGGVLEHEVAGEHAEIHDDDDDEDEQEERNEAEPRDAEVEVWSDDPETRRLQEKARLVSRDELLQVLQDRYAHLLLRNTRGRMTPAQLERFEARRKLAAERLARKEAAQRAEEAGQGFVSEVDVGGDDNKEEAAEEEEEEAGASGKRVRFADAPESNSQRGSSKELSHGATISDSLSQVPHPQLIVGTVGYPNVGKSSVINVLMGATSRSHRTKRVGVGSTPGKTKHFQTLEVSDELMLCDCPGLVFPSFLADKGELVVNGILPIDQLRDHVTAVHHLCQRIPRPVLQQTYGIRLPPPRLGEDPNRPPGVRELLDTYCTSRSFMASSHAGPDHPRGARFLLKDFVSGRLLYCHPPPTVRDPTAFLDATDASRAMRDEAAAVSLRQQLQRRARADEDRDRLRHATTWDDVMALAESSGVDGRRDRIDAELDDQWEANVLLPEAMRSGNDAGHDDVASGESSLPASEQAALDRLLHSMQLTGSSDRGNSADADFLANLSPEDRAQLEAGPRATATRAPRRKGAGRKPRRRRKGERDPDPYGTQLEPDEAADASMDREEMRRKQLEGLSHVHRRPPSGMSGHPAGPGAAGAW